MVSGAAWGATIIAHRRSAKTGPRGAARHVASRVAQELRAVMGEPGEVALQVGHDPLGESPRAGGEDLARGRGEVVADTPGDVLGRAVVADFALGHRDGAAARA